MLDSEYLLFTNKKHSNKCFEPKMEEQKKPYDIIFKINCEEIYAHRSVMLRSEGVFKDIIAFTSNANEEEIEEIPIPYGHIEVSALKDIISYLYTREIKVTNNNVCSLLTTFDYLGFEKSLKAYGNFLQKQLKTTQYDSSHLICEKVFDIRYFFKWIGENRLLSSIEKFIGRNLMSLVKSNDILHLSVHDFETLLKSDYLITDSEEDIFEASLAWIKFKPEERISLLPQVLENIRFNLLSSEYVQKKAHKEVLQLLPTHKFEIKNDKYKVLFPKSRSRDFGAVGEIYVIGGDDDKSMEKYSPLTKKWEIEGLMKTKREDICVAVVKDKLYILGGVDPEGSLLSTCEVYDFAMKNWSECCEMPTPRSLAASVFLNKCIYVCGGLFKEILKSVICYKPNEDRWRELSPLFEARAQAAAVVCDGYVYVLGGLDNMNNDLNSVERYDPKKNCWEKVKHMNHKRVGLGAAVLKGKIFACGGFNKQHGVLKSVEIYDQEEDEWKMVSSFTSGKDNLSVVSNEGNLWAIGGFLPLEVYSPEKNEWTRAPQLEKYRRNAVAVVIP